MWVLYTLKKKNIIATKVQPALLPYSSNARVIGDDNECVFSALGYVQLKWRLASVVDALQLTISSQRM